MRVVKSHARRLIRISLLGDKFEIHRLRGETIFVGDSAIRGLGGVEFLEKSCFEPLIDLVDVFGEGIRDGFL